MLWAVNSTRGEPAKRVDGFELDCVSNTGRTREAGGSIKPGAQAPGIENKNKRREPTKWATEARD